MSKRKKLQPLIRSPGLKWVEEHQELLSGYQEGFFLVDLQTGKLLAFSERAEEVEALLDRDPRPGLFTFHYGGLPTMGGAVLDIRV